MIAVSESTPGPIVVNLAAYVGSSQAGLLGSIIAALAVVLPSYHHSVGDGAAQNCTQEQVCPSSVEDSNPAYGKLSDDTAERYDDGMLEDMFSEARVMQRVMYLRFSVTIPAGGSVDVIAQMTKDASIDFIGANKDRNGYDMVTQLGSNLTFTSQIASISNTDNIEIIDQSFGFDLANGITEVELDMSVAHYWLEVRKLPQEETP